MKQDKTPKLYLLFSVDIIDSTKRKYENSDYSSWFLNIRQFYDEFSQLFYVNYTSFASELSLSNKDSEKFINVWKLVGDEILFYVDINNEKEALLLIYSFSKTIYSYNKANRTSTGNNEHPLTVKGSIWTAQVPFIDRVYETNQKDFVGPSVDCGFRIGKLSDKNRIAVSMEVAAICLEDKDNILKFKKENIVLSFGKMEYLKGVFKGKTEYPVFFITRKENLNIHEHNLKSFTNTKQLKKFLASFYKNLQKGEIKDSISPLSFPLSGYLTEKEQISEEAINKEKTKVPEIDLYGKIQKPESNIVPTTGKPEDFALLAAKLQ